MQHIFMKRAFALCMVTASSAASAQSLGYALTHGTVDFGLRPRYESVVQPAPNVANAFTVRSLLGYETAPYAHVRAMLQLIDVAGIVEDYNSILNHDTRYSVIPDPEAYNVNQAYLSFTGIPATKVRVGRQIIVLNNARFVGNVGFRQTMQTFDAVSLVNKSVPGLTLYGAYSWRLKDILNQLLPVHVTLLNAGYVLAPGTLATLYSYTYENTADTAIPGAALCAVAGGPQVCNSETAGVRVAGHAPISSALRLLYTGDYARQWHVGGGSPLINAAYYHVGGGVGMGPTFARVDYEVMGSNSSGTYGFQTPLATKHMFNGWAEVFLVTPPAGLKSTYATLGTAVARVKLAASYYRFRADHGSLQYGHEWDLSAVYPFRPGLVGGVQYANYHAHQYGVNTKAAWVFVSYHYE